MMDKKEKRSDYVLGFCFSTDFKKVVLIRKLRPEWQAGNLNGVGGKIEVGESGLEAMIREFKEETGVETTDWKNFTCLYGSTKKGDKWYVECYRTSIDLSGVQTTTDEQVEIIDVRSLQYQKLMFNLRWLVPMALDKQIVSSEIHNY